MPLKQPHDFLPLADTFVYLSAALATRTPHWRSAPRDCVCCVCCICRPCTAQTRTAARRHACPPCSVLHALDLQSHFQTSGRNVRQRIAPGFGLLLHGLSLLGPYTAVHSINTAGKDVPSGPYCWSCDPKCLVPGVLSGVLVLLHIVPQSVPWFLQEIKHIYHARPAPWRACSL